MLDELIAGLTCLLSSDDDCDAAISAVAIAIKTAGAEVEIEASDDEPDALNNDDALWVVSTHKLAIDGQVVAEWTRCAMGCYGEAGRQCSDDEWCVSEDTNGNDVLPGNVAAALSALGLDDDIPDVPEPDKATDTYEPDPDGEYAVYWETVGDDSHVCQRYATHDAAVAVCGQRNREFAASNPSGGGTTYLCGYSVRQLDGGEWVPVDADE